MPKDAEYELTPGVVVTAAPGDIEALQGGELDLAVAFMQGRAKVAGDMKAFLEWLTRSQLPRSR